MTRYRVLRAIAYAATSLLGAMLACKMSEANLATSPIVGLMYNDQISISINGQNPGHVRLEYRQSGSPKTIRTEWQTLHESQNLTTDFILTEIKPNASYDYRLEFEGGAQSEWFSFQTFPPQGVPGKFNFVFSACTREREKPHQIFRYIDRLSPTFVALLGDNMYADYDGDVNDAPSSDVLDIFRQKYRRNFDEHFQKMSRGIPVIAIWDDHEYGQDNSDRNYRYKQIAKDVFKETFPSYPYEVENGGLYYKFTVADVDFFALDTRWYRSPMQNDDGPEKTMLGATQLEWLLAGLKESRATFKMVLSSVSFNDYGGDVSSGRSGYDSWMDYKFERDQILSAIEQNHIRGVMVFSGDQHYPSAYLLNWKHPLTAVAQTDTSAVFSINDLGIAVFDFSASPLHYRRSTGEPLNSAQQDDPRYSYEIFRASWGEPANETPDVITSVYGLAEIDTESAKERVSVRFFELNPTSARMDQLYRIDVTFP